MARDHCYIKAAHETNRQEHYFDDTISSLETDVDHLKDDLETHNDPEYEISSEREVIQKNL